MNLVELLILLVFLFASFVCVCVCVCVHARARLTDLSFVMFLQLYVKNNKSTT